MNTKIFGIVNITKDSFSDGGKFFEAEAAISHALKLAEAGAYAIDLGPASSNPNAGEVPAAEEIRRLEPVVARLQEENITISIDSYRTATQRWAIHKNITYLNDIQGFADRNFYEELASSGCQLIVMHAIQRFGKAQKRYSDPQTIMDTIYRFFDDRLAALENAGVNRQRLILDPGMGFFLGSNPEASLEVLRSIPALKQRYDLPVFISVSRKSFLRKLTGQDVGSVQAATLSAEIYAALQGADYIRTHDVQALNDALTIQNALRKQ